MINNTHILPPKSPIEIRDHFRERVMSRHEILITNSDYDIICTKENVRKNFIGVYKKNGSKTVGYLNLQYATILCLYQKDKCDDGTDGKFVTAYPKNADTTDEEIMRVCFGSREILKFAMICYSRFQEEMGRFKSEMHRPLAEIGKFLFVESDYCFPQAMIEIYKKGEYSKWHMCRRIRDIIFGDNEKVEMHLRKKLPNERDVQECDARDDAM